MPVRELWHADAFASDAGRKRARQPPTVQSFARPITPEEVDSESDDDGVEDDEEQPVDGDAEGHKTTQGPTTDACTRDSDGVVAGERVLEHGTVAAAGGRSREGGSADDDVEAVSPGGSVQRAANAGGNPPPGDKDFRRRRPGRRGTGAACPDHGATPGRERSVQRRRGT